MQHKGLASVARQLSPKVWGNIPLRSCAALIGGNGRIANPMSLEQAAAGVLTPGGDVLNGTAPATAGVSTVDRAQRIIPVTNTSLLLGFPNCNADFTQTRRWGYEVCFALADASTHGFAAGLTSRASAGVDAFAASTVFFEAEVVTTNVSFLGFRKPEDTDVDIFYKTDGSAIPTTAATGLHTTTADTMEDGVFVKLGMNSDGRNIRFFVDNAQIGDPVSLDDAYLPAEADLLPLIAFYSNGVTTIDMSWMAFAEVN